MSFSPLNKKVWHYTIFSGPPNGSEENQMKFQWGADSFRCTLMNGLLRDPFICSIFSFQSTHELKLLSLGLPCGSLLVKTLRSHCWGCLGLVPGWGTQILHARDQRKKKTKPYNKGWCWFAKWPSLQRAKRDWKKTQSPPDWQGTGLIWARELSY